MNIEFIVQDNQTGVIYDATEVLEGFTWSGQIYGQPGKLTFDVIRDGVLKFYEGSIVRLTVDGYKLFYGYVFSKSRSNLMRTSVTAYDQMRYLKYPDVITFPESTVSDRFAHICGLTEKIKYKVVHPSKYVLDAAPFDGKTYADMLQDGFDNTLINAKQMYFVRDNFGTLEFLDIAKLKTDLIISEDSLLENYDYNTSIDESTYNQIKITRNNKETGKRDVYIVKDSDTIARWGRLQHHETADEKLTSAQIEQKADNLLKAKNRVTRKLSLNCSVGDFRVMPGNGVWVETEFDDMMLSRYMIVHSCSHTVKNERHSMKLSLEVAE